MTETPSRSNNVAAGRTTSVVTSAGTTTLAYDYEGRISTVTYPSSATNGFTYNGLDTRVGKVDTAGTTTYRRDGDDVLSPVLEAGGTKFTPGISRRTGTSSYFYHQDRMGSAIRQTNSTQGSLTSRQYDAFGNVAYVGGTWVGPFGFVGGEGYQEDSDSGLQLLGHRYYDPSTGRFLTRDPIQDGRNWYGYCDSNPLKWVDPQGTDKIILPKNPSGLPPGWKKDPNHRPPNGGGRYYPPEGGEGLEFHHGRPGVGGHGGKDHWHKVGKGKNGKPEREDGDYNPGDTLEINEPKPAPGPNWEAIGWGIGIGVVVVGAVGLIIVTGGAAAAGGLAAGGAAGIGGAIIINSPHRPGGGI